MRTLGHRDVLADLPDHRLLAFVLADHRIGRDALLKQKGAGLTRKLVGFEMRGRGIGRDGYEVLIDNTPAGWVTSGSPAPTLNKNIGLCYLPLEFAKTGQKIQVVVRNQPVDAEVVETPFYKRSK